MRLNRERGRHRWVFESIVRTVAQLRKLFRYLGLVDFNPIVCLCVFEGGIQSDDTLAREGMDRCHVTMNISINYCADVVFIDSGMSEMVLALQIISCVASCLCLLRRMFMIGVAFVGVSQLCPFVGLSWISRSLGQTARYTSRRSPCTVDPLAFQICSD